MAKSEGLTVLYAGNQDVSAACEAAGVSKGPGVRICHPRYFAGLESGCTDVLYYENPRFAEAAESLKAACAAAKIGFKVVKVAGKAKAKSKARKKPKAKGAD